MELSLLYIVIGGVCCLALGAVVVALAWVLVWRTGMSRKAAEEDSRQQIMEGLNRSCEGIESYIGAANPAAFSTPQFKHDLQRRTGALRKRLDEFRDVLDIYYAKYVELRITLFENLRGTPGALSGDVAGPGSAGGQAVAEAEAGEPAAAAPAETPVAEAAQPAEEQAGAAPDIDVGATMLFEVPAAEQPAEAEAAQQAAPQPRGFEMPPEPPAMPQWQPAPGQAPTPLQPAAAGAADFGDADVMYGQTIQFSRLDVEAAKRGEQVSPAMAPQPAASIEEPDDTDATVVMFPPTGIESASAPAPQAPVFQQPPAFQPPPGVMAAPKATPGKRGTPPPVPVPQASKQAEDGSMINGDDLMEQMDAFFKFDK